MNRRLVLAGSAIVALREIATVKATGSHPPGCRRHSECGDGHVCGCDGLCYQSVVQNNTCTLITTVVVSAPRRRLKKRKKGHHRRRKH